MRLFGAVVRLGPALYRLAHRIELDNDMAIARSRIESILWEAAWAEGQAMTLEQAIAYALDGTAPSAEPTATRVLVP